jgi:hypothetical protein
MTGCERVETFLASAEGASRRQPPAEVRAHLDQCGPCRRLFEFSTTQESVEVPRETRSCIEERLKRSLHPVRPLPCRWTLMGMFMAIFAAGAGIWLIQTGWGGARDLTGVQLAGTLVALAAAAALAAAVLGAEMIPGERRLPPIGVVALVAIGGLAALVAALFPWESAGSPWLASAMTCHAHGAIIAIPTAAVALFALRRGAPMCAGTAGAAIGLLAGLAAMATLHVGCARHGVLHITAGHLSIPAGAALIGFLVGKVIGRWRSARALT